MVDNTQDREPSYLTDVFRNLEPGRIRDLMATNQWVVRQKAYREISSGDATEPMVREAGNQIAAMDQELKKKDYTPAEINAAVMVASGQITLDIKK